MNGQRIPRRREGGGERCAGKNYGGNLIIYKGRGEGE